MSTKPGIARRVDALVFIVLLIAIAMGAALASAATQAVAVDKPQSQADVDFAPLNAPLETGVQAPESFTTFSSMMSNVDTESLRPIAEGKLGSYWVFLREDRVCFIAELPDGIAGSGCRPVAEFHKEGAVLRVVSTRYAVDLVVVPDGYSTTKLGEPLVAGVYEIDPVNEKVDTNIAFVSESGTEVEVHRPDDATTLIDPAQG